MPAWVATAPRTSTAHYFSIGSSGRLPHSDHEPSYSAALHKVGSKQQGAVGDHGPQTQRQQHPLTDG